MMAAPTDPSDHRDPRHVGSTSGHRQAAPEPAAAMDPSWLELVDDPGTTVWIGELGTPELIGRCEHLGLQRVDDPAQADTVMVTARELGSIVDLADTVTVVCLVANRLRHAPGVRRTGRSVPAGSLRRVAAATGVDGIRRGEVFGLLPSIDHPRSALSLRSRQARRLVVGALALHVRGVRLVLLRLLATAGRIAAPLYPGWVVVAHGRARATAPRISGQFGYAQNDDVTRFLGEPPVLIERAGRALHRAEEEAALRELATTSFAPLVPHIEASPDHRRGLITSRLPGTALSPRDLSDDELVRWTERAAATLAHLQRATRHDDGTVLVHGDFWLGNLTAHGDAVTGVFDWELAHRGSPQEDRDFLVTGLVQYLHRDDAFADRLRMAVTRGLGAPR